MYLIIKRITFELSKKQKTNKEMSRYIDHAPIGFTCPIIDRVISFIDSAKEEAEWVRNNKDAEDISSEITNIIDELEDAINEIENVREANQELRDWGNEEYNRAEKAEDERDQLADKKESLESEIKECNIRIEELEDLI